MKECHGCRRVLPHAQFAKGKNYPDGFRPRCRECRRAEYATRTDEQKARDRAKRRAYYEAHREEHLAKCSERYWSNPSPARERARQWRALNPEAKAAADAARRKAKRTEFLAYLREYNKRNRLLVLAAYGGACACCSERRPEFLALDHIYGDGAEHRKATGLLGTQLVNWLIKNGMPRGQFQILCHNCNTAKGKDRTCPHVIERAALLDAETIDVSRAWPFIA